MAMLIAKGGSSTHLDATNSKMLGIGERKVLLEKPVHEDDLVLKTKEKLVLGGPTVEPSAANSISSLRGVKEESKKVPQGTEAMPGLTSIAERKRIGGKNLINESAISTPIFRKIGRKEKLVLGGPTVEPSAAKSFSNLRGVKEESKKVPQGTKGGKNLKNGSAVSTPIVRKIERKRYFVEMDAEEYENLGVFKSHTCVREKCHIYYQCVVRARAVESHFKKFMEETFGRKYVKMVIGLDVEYTIFICELSDKELEILKDTQGVVNVELAEEGPGYYL